MGLFLDEKWGVPGAGLEPAQPIGPGDFKSPVSTNSTTPAAQVDNAYYSLEATTGFEPVNSGFADRPLRPLGYVALRPQSYITFNRKTPT